MNRKQKIIISVTGIFIVLLALVGLTYAYFLTQIRGNEETKSISVTTANLKLVYNDGTEGVIGGVNLFPSDTEYTKTFTVTNEGNVNIEYGVYLINVINEFELKDDIKYTMSCSTNGTIECNQSLNETTFPSGIKELIKNEIEPNKTHTYTFKFTYKDSGTDQSVDMNKKLEAKIQIFVANESGNYIPYEEGTLAYHILNNGADVKVINKTGVFNENNEFGNNDLDACLLFEVMSGIKTCFVEGTEKINIETKNTKKVKTEVNVEKIADGKSWDNTLNDFTNDGIFSIEDDYGTSYYYRGPVTNNYLTFNNSCWRIVRIEGDGSVKLVLEDKASDCKNSDGIWDIYQDKQYLDENDYLFSSGIKNFNVYDNDSLAKNINTLYFLQNINGNYGLYLMDDLSMLKSGNWCYNNKAYADKLGKHLLTEEEKNSYYNTGTKFYYDTYVRLYGKTIKEPTLKCNGVLLNEFIVNEAIGGNDHKKIYFGALTADEVYLATGTIMHNPYSYLRNEYSNDVSNHQHSLTLSPYGYLINETGYENYETFISHGYYGYMDNYPLNDTEHKTTFRPAMRMAASAKPQDGIGTKDDPYVFVYDIYN